MNPSKRRRRQRKHVSFPLATDTGNVGYVYGDPDMSEETKDALRVLIDHVANLTDEQWAEIERKRMEDGE